MIKTTFYTIACILLGVLSSGCSSIINSHTQKEPIVHAYLSGDKTDMMTRLEAKLQSATGTGDELMWHLELGTAHFIHGDFKTALDHFDRAEILIEDYDNRAILSFQDGSAEVAMLATNLNALPYRGWCRDRIALSIYKSLAYLGAGNEDGFHPQLRRLRDVQKKVRQDYKVFTDSERELISNAETENNQNVTESMGLTYDKDSQPILAESQRGENPEFNEALMATNEVARKGYANFLNPMALYLSALASLRDGDWENAAMDFKELYMCMPDNPVIRNYYATILKKANTHTKDIPPALRTERGFDFPIDRQCVYVIFANGHSAAFRPINIYFPIMVAWPACEYYDAPYTELSIQADNGKNRTLIIADMDGILSREYNERLFEMVTRIVLNTIIKEGTTAAATYVAFKAHPLAGIAVYISGLIYKYTFNTADTRSWELLPKNFQITQFPMPKNHRVVVAPDDRSDLAQTVEIPKKARSAIIFVNAPSHNVFNIHVLPITAQ